MPRPKKSVTDEQDRYGSVATNLFLGCPSTPVCHPDLPIACRIKKGKRRFHIECGACGSRTLLGKSWGDGNGLTAHQVNVAGMLILEPHAPTTNGGTHA